MSRLNTSSNAVLQVNQCELTSFPLNDTSQKLTDTLEGSHSTNGDAPLFWRSKIAFSPSEVLIYPLNIAVAVMYRPWRGLAAHMLLFAENIDFVKCFIL